MTNEELIYLYRQGDKQALEKLIEKNRGIVYKIANKFYIEGTNAIDREDLEQEGYIGLITAASKYKFDIDNRAKFITYAIHWIYQKISRYVKTKSTNEEASLNTPIGEDGDMELGDYIEGVDYGFENIEEKLYNQQLRKELEEIMSNYNTLQERQILKLRYGWDNNCCMTLEEVGCLFDVTGIRARQIQNKAMRKIRRTLWGKNKAKEILLEKQLTFDMDKVADNIMFIGRWLNS